MNTLSVFLLDDNPVFLDAFESKLSDWLRENSAFSFSIRRFSDPAELLVAAGGAAPDLAILDIDLGEGVHSGIETAAALRTLCPGCGIIYLTAYLQYATDIYETAPLYFILKEEYAARIPMAMRRFFQYWAEAQQYISLSSDHAAITIPLAQLVYCERSDRTVWLYLADGRRFSSTLGIRGIYEKLPGAQFSICHRGYIVNHRFIQSTKRGEITLSTGKVLPIGRSCLESFRANYHHWMANYL